MKLDAKNCVICGESVVGCDDVVEMHDIFYPFDPKDVSLGRFGVVHDKCGRRWLWEIS